MKDQNTAITGLQTDTCFIVMYSSNEKKMELRAYDSEDSARDSITRNVRSIEQHLRLQKKKPESIINDSGNSSLYVPDTDIYHSWQLSKTTITYQNGKLSPTQKPDVFGFITKECYIVADYSYSDGTSFCAFDTLDAAKESIHKSALHTKDEMEMKGYWPTLSFDQESKASVTVPGTNINFEWTITKSSICIQIQKLDDVVVTELCPSCGMEVTMNWNTETMGYHAFCPHCGNTLMLCDVCRHSDPPCVCDYDSEDGCCQHTKLERKVPAVLGVDTPLGTIIIRAESFSGRGIYVDLRRSDVDQDLPLVHVNYTSHPLGYKNCIKAEIFGDGRKDKKAESIYFNNIEDFFRTDGPDYIILVSPTLAVTMINDLGNGRDADNGDRTSQYFTIAKGRQDISKTVRVCLVENKNGLSEGEQYYSLHMIDDVSGDPCKWFNTDLNEDALEQQIKEILDGLEGTNYAP